MKKISLVNLKADHKCRVAEVLGGQTLRQKLSSMGLYEGRAAVKLSHIGLRGPVVIKVGHSILALGHGLASKVMVEEE